MKVVQERTDELNAILRVTLEPEDYRERVESSIKNYQKKAQMPGFRPGKIPVGMIRKMYGKSILVDEINRILNDSIMGYIREQSLDIIGQPLPSEKESKEIKNVELISPGTRGTPTLFEANETKAKERMRSKDQTKLRIENFLFDEKR